MGTVGLVARKAAGALLTLAFVVVFNFFLFRVLPGDPAKTFTRNQPSTPERLVEIRRAYGFDQSLWEQFRRYLVRLAHGDLDRSFRLKQPVAGIIVDRLWPTVLLMTTSLVLAAVIGLWIGARGGWRRGSTYDHVTTNASLAFYAMPESWLGLMLLPALVMALPGAALFYWLDGYFGYKPLEPGKAAILTVQLKSPLNGAVPAVHSPRGIEVETGVRLNGGRQISWRIRASQPASGKLAIVFPGETVEKSVEAGVGPRHVSGRRVSTLSGLFGNPAESLLKSDRVEWVEIRYPQATVAAAGLELPWAAWLVFFSMIAALGLKNRFGVAF